MKWGRADRSGASLAQLDVEPVSLAVSLTFEAMAERRGRIKRQASRARVHRRSAYGG